jgi:biopolymer transport protein TolR
VRKSHYTTLAEINVTSLVDVTMVLLIIFMLTAPFIQAGIDVRLPRVRSEIIQNRQAVVLTIAGEDEIYLNQEKTTFAKLEQAMAEVYEDPGQRVFLRADQGVPYGVVMRAVDVLKRMGIENLGLVTEPVPDEAGR